MTHDEFNPYVGPRPFERRKEDFARFFGRSQETEEIVSLIFGHPVILVYAQSGAGKTSLFNASVAPRLEENGFEVLPLTRVGGVVPKGIALREIKDLYVFNALLKMDSETDPRTLMSMSLRTFLETRARTTDENGQPLPRVVIFDQFEELFTYTPERWREQREGFFKQVVEALSADPLLRVVFVIREDFLAELDPYARSLPERLRTRYRLERLGETAALRAVKDPLVNTPRRFAPEVAEGLVKELLVMRAVDATGKTTEIEGQYVEPVQLQVVCVTLWSTLEPDVTEIEKSHLKNFNVSDALSNFYKSAVEAAAKETGVPENQLRNWFGKTLITPMGTRSTVFRGEDSTGGIENSAVDFLESRHIIRAEFRAGARWYELTHDRLVEPILANNRKWLETLSPLQQQAALWNDQGRNDTWLLIDQALLEVEQWSKEHEKELTDVEKDFLGECRVHQTAIDQRKELEAQQQKLLAEQKLNKQRRFVAYAAVIAMVIMGGLAVFGFVQLGLATENRAKAEQQAATAQAASTRAFGSAATASANEQFAGEQVNIAFSNSLSSQSNTLINADLQTSILLGIEAFRISDTLQSRGLLLNLAQANPRLVRYLRGHADAVYAVAFNPDGTILASAGNDDTIILWDVETGQQIGKHLTGHSDAITSIAFSRDGTVLASGSYDRTIMLWDVETAQPIGQPLSGHTDAVTSLAFGMEGQILASGSWDGTVRLWDIEERQAIEPTLNGHASAVSSLAFSPDGRTLASGSYDQTTILWDVNTRQPIGEPLSEFSDAITTVAFGLDNNILATGSCAERSGDNCIKGQLVLWDLNSRQMIGQPLLGHNSFITDVSFSPDGKILASSSDDKTILLWDVETGQPIASPLTGHTDVINSVAFSPDGRHLASGSSDTTVILWDMEDRPQIAQPLTGHTDYVLSVAFSPDGKTVASGGWDNTIRLWNRGTSQEIAQLTGHFSAVSAVAFSPDGDTLASGSYDNSVILWNTDAQQPTGEPLTGHAASVLSVAFSPNGKILASSSSDGTILLWDVKTRQIVGESFGVNADAVTSVVFSPDGQTLASGSNDANVMFWDVTTRQPIGQPLAAHTAAVTGLAFSPDGKMLASSSTDMTIILWDTETLQPIGQPLAGHTDLVISVAFSPDSRTLASGSLDGTVILWDVAARQSIGQPLTGHTGPVSSVAFSPDGRTLASASYDTTIILWDIDQESLIQKSCARVGRNFTRAEWEGYFRDQAYRQTCAQWPLEPEALPTVVVTQLVEVTATSTPVIVAATATPTITPTGMATATPPVTFRVVNVTEDDRLNIRAGPGIKYEIIGKIPNDGTGILITGPGTQADNTIWVPIIYNGISGWVNSFYLSKE